MTEKGELKPSEAHLKVVACEDSRQVALKAAGKLSDFLRNNANAVLGLCAGGTPRQTYAELGRIHRESGLSFGGARFFCLDEYRGLSDDHPQSFRQFMNESLFSKIDVPLWRTHVLNGMAIDVSKECEAFEAMLRANGGVDCWFLGIGTNGHIAFNEPGSQVDSRTRMVDLSPETIAANGDGHFFDFPGQVPRQALSVGMATILEARQILLVATGATKAKAIAAALEGPVTQTCPASYLQTHESVCVIIDQAAAAALTSVSSLEGTLKTV